MRTNRKYPRELKLDLVRQCFEGVKEVTEVAAENDIDTKLLCKWISKYREQGESAFDLKSTGGSFIKDATKIPPVLYKELGLDKIRENPAELKNAQTENEKLKLIIAEKELEIRMLRDLLKKTKNSK